MDFLVHEPHLETRAVSCYRVGPVIHGSKHTSGQELEAPHSLPRILSQKSFKTTSFSTEWIFPKAAHPLASSGMLVMRFKQTGIKDSCDHWEFSEYLQVKQSLYLLLMENQESNSTKRSNQPLWSILEGSSKTIDQNSWGFPAREVFWQELFFWGGSSRESYFVLFYRPYFVSLASCLK